MVQFFCIFFVFSEEEDEEKEDDYFHSVSYCLRFSLFVTSASNAAMRRILHIATMYERDL